MALEIERKFLVSGEFKSYATRRIYLSQGYVYANEKKTVRVRIADERGFLTIKGPSLKGGLARFEWEKEISRSEAEELMHLCENGIVEKYRWIIPVADNLKYEVDEFLGDNAGLVIAEIELPDENASFERLPFLGKEVTGDHRYYNAYLSAFPYRRQMRDAERE